MGHFFSPASAEKSDLAGSWNKKKGLSGEGNKKTSSCKVTPLFYIFCHSGPDFTAMTCTLPPQSCASGTDFSISAAANVLLIPDASTRQRSIDDIIQVQIRSRGRIMFPEKPLEC